MHKLGAVAATAVAIAAAGATGAQAGAADSSSISGLNSPDRIAGHYIVVLDDGTGVAAAASTAERMAGASVDNVYRSTTAGFNSNRSRWAADV